MRWEGAGAYSKGDDCGGENVRNGCVRVCHSGWERAKYCRSSSATSFHAMSTINGDDCRGVVA